MEPLSGFDQAVMSAGMIAAYSFVGYVHLALICSNILDRTPKDLFGRHATRRKTLVFIQGCVGYLLVPTLVAIVTDLSANDLWNGASEWQHFIAPMGWVIWFAFLAFLAYPAFAALTIYYIIRRNRHHKRVNALMS